MKIKSRYNLNKSLKVGDDCVCPSCGTKFTKTNYQQAFCKTKSGTVCKDKYWNTVTPNKRNNKTRISPANARFMSKQKKYTSEGYQIINGTAYDEYGDPVYDVNSFDNEHPFSSEGLDQW
jgi:hypothetical protein